MTANILIVDDLPENLMVLEGVLGGLPVNLVRATSGEEALKHLLQQEFAAILLDVQMPGMDGYQTAALIREREKTQRTPIIFITAIHNSEENVFHGYELGAVDYIVKPIRPRILRAKVAVFVDLYNQAEQIRALKEAEHEQQMAEMRMKMEEEALAQRLDALRVSQRMLQSTLDALPMYIAILDESGVIIAANAAWEELEDDRFPFGVRFGIGSNYLEVCEASTGDLAGERAALAGGIRGAMVQQRGSFYFEYNRADSDGLRCFVARVSRFEDHEARVRVVVVHEDVTRLKR